MKLKKVVMIASILGGTLFADESMRWNWEGYHAIRHETSITDDGRVNTTTSATIPIVMNQNIFIGSILNYEATEGVESRDPFTHTGRVGVGVHKPLSEMWHIYSEANFGITGWWDEPSNGLSMFLFSFAGYKPREDLFLRGGVALLGHFEQYHLFPLLGTSWIITPSIALDLLLPQHLLFRYKLNPNWETGTKIHYGMKASQKKEDEGAKYFYEESTLFTGLYLEYSIAENLKIRLNGGPVLYHEQNLFEKGKDKLKSVEMDRSWRFELTFRRVI